MVEDIRDMVDDYVFPFDKKIPWLAEQIYDGYINKKMIKEYVRPELFASRSDFMWEFNAFFVETYGPNFTAKALLKKNYDTHGYRRDSLRDIIYSMIIWPFPQAPPKQKYQGPRLTEFSSDEERIQRSAEQRFQRSARDMAASLAAGLLMDDLDLSEEDAFYMEDNLREIGYLFPDIYPSSKYISPPPHGRTKEILREMSK